MEAPSVARGWNSSYRYSEWREGRAQWGLIGFFFGLVFLGGFIDAVDPSDSAGMIAFAAGLFGAPLLALLIVALRHHRAGIFEREGRLLVRSAWWSRTFDWCDIETIGFGPAGFPFLADGREVVVITTRDGKRWPIGTLIKGGLWKPWISTTDTAEAFVAALTERLAAVRANTDDPSSRSRDREPSG